MYLCNQLNGEMSTTEKSLNGDVNCVMKLTYFVILWDIVVCNDKELYLGEFYDSKRLSFPEIPWEIKTVPSDRRGVLIRDILHALSTLCPFLKLVFIIGFTRDLIS